MSLASRIAARSRRPTATVYLDGRRWDHWLELSVDQAYGQNISAGAVVGRTPPATPRVGMAISWSWGYDGYHVAGFNGVVSEVAYSAYPRRVSLRVADLLWKADRQQKDIATDPLNSIAASAAIRQILQGAGLTRLSIPTLAASGSAWGGGEWVLGNLTPVAFPNSTALAAAAKICETLGYWLYADASGVVRATLMERRPSSSVARTLTWGQDFILRGSPRRTQPDTQLNRVVVRGANTGVAGAQIWDEWQTGAGDRSREFSFPLVEYVNESEAGAASATGVAKRLLKLWSREPNVIDVDAFKADPRFAVGQTIGIVCEPIGYSSVTPFFIYRLSSRLDRRKGDFTQAIQLDGGTGNQGYTLVPPPLASFAWRIVRETLDGAGVVELFLDGTGSTSGTGGEIVSWSWSTATATTLGTPTTATGPQAMFVYPAATLTASVTLTVTDTSSKTASLTQVINLAGDELTQPFARILSVALGSAWAASPDGGQTWNVEASGDATLVPEVSGEELVATRGTGSTGLRSTADVLATASTSLASLGGGITALAQTVGAGERVWAAVGANLYRSIDAGVTFSLWGTLPAMINAVLEDPAVLNSVFCLAGANMYHSTLDTPGTAWNVLYAGPSGATARHLVRHTGLVTWICYTGTFVGSPLQRVEGPITALFPTVTPAVTKIRAIAMPPDESVVYVWDSEGRGWVVDSATGIAEATGADLGAGYTAQHALHDLDDSIVYLAAFGATEGPVYKFWPLQASAGLQAFYTPAAGQQAHRVGLSGTGLPSTPVTVVTNTTDTLAVTLWNGSGNDAEPEGWYTNGYDDSGWSAAVGANLYINPEPIAGASAVWTSYNTLDWTEEILTRQAFTIPAGEIRNARLTVRLDDRGEVYLNGVLVYTDTTYTPGSAGPPEVVELNPAILVLGENVIAVHGINNETLAHVAYKLEVNYLA